MKMTGDCEYIVSIPRVSSGHIWTWRTHLNDSGHNSWLEEGAINVFWVPINIQIPSQKFSSPEDGQMNFRARLQPNYYNRIIAAE